MTLRGAVICPDPEVAARFDEAVAEIPAIQIIRELRRYPDALELMRMIRSSVPHVVFLSLDDLAKALELLEVLKSQAPGIQVAALSRSLDPAALLEAMRAGIRECLAMPFDRGELAEAASRISSAVRDLPALLEVTEHVYAFLPSKQGVGTSTVAMNTAIALGRRKKGEVLLLDMDLSSGIIGFMLKLSNAHCIVDAAENAHSLDESIWDQIVCKKAGIDIVHTGRLNPDFRIDAQQIRYILDFARRNYKTVCVDISGNLEKYSIEVMHEAKTIFMVVTSEIPSLHLAREKLGFLQRLDLADRVKILLNRHHKKSLVSPSQIEGLLGVPIAFTFQNDYQGVHAALQDGRAVEPNSELGRQFQVLADSILGLKEEDAGPAPQKKRVAEFFSILPPRVPATGGGRR
ncbi:MAG: transcriptional regulator [Bryobacteraceae bacterium]|nr:MAG: transcriptional regulator [Bryobacteraceae bacterium]